MIPDEPTYAELATRTPPRSSWGLFGDADEVGTLNRIGSREVAAAAALVTTGAIFPLDWPLHLPDPPLFGRRPMQHQVIRELNNGHDERYDGFYPQASSQWDALSHIAHPRYGFYNNRRAVGEESDSLGIDVWARRGIAGRFVLLDLVHDAQERGAPIDPRTSHAVDAPDLDAALARQEVDLRRGDIVLLHFGWTRWYEGLEPEARRVLAEDSMAQPAPGLARTDGVLAWLWDHGVAAVAADVPALEVMPFDNMTEGEFLHFDLIPMLGMAIGEMFDLHGLAAYCRTAGRWTGLLTSAPLHCRGGIGSTANALALM